MDVFWNGFIEPVLQRLGKSKIVEIGSSSGVNTKNLLEFCQRTDSRLHIIDPLEIGNIDELRPLLDRYGRHHKALSLQVLGEIGPADVYLIDGDHNWYTVYNELKQILDLHQDSSSSQSARKPTIFFHDVEWPYARRDLYYDPSNIPDEHKQPFSYDGIVPGEVELNSDVGINFGLANATTEGGPNNGVLTAIENVISERDLLNSFRWYVLPSFHGLGCLFPKQRYSDEIEREVDQILSPPENIRTYLKDLEGRRIAALLQASDSHRKLVKTTEDYQVLTTVRDDIQARLNDREEKLQLLEHLQEQIRNQDQNQQQVCGFAQKTLKVIGRMRALLPPRDRSH